MIVTEEVCKQIIKCNFGNREFHTVELSNALTEYLQVTIKTDVARYWAIKLAASGYLLRRQIAPQLYAYALRLGVNLPSSVTIGEGEAEYT